MSEIHQEDPAVDEPPSAEFLWGAATSAYQIEGGVADGGRGPSIWDDFAHTPGAVRNGETGDVACDHYHRWRTDLDLAAEIGLAAYRCSVSWSRLQPAGEGRLNPEGVEFYRSVLEGCHERGIRPFVTLYHWDLPAPLEAAGGWPVRATAERFEVYAGLVAESLGDLVADWITINEPWCAAFLGYYEGAHAPGRRDLPSAVRAAHHLNLAHGLGVRAMRDAGAADHRIGLSNLVTDVVPASDRPDDVAAASRVDANANQLFLAPAYAGHYTAAVHDLYDDHGLRDVVLQGDLEVIAEATDFAGVNHYHRNVVSADGADPHLGASLRHAEPTPTALGWSLRPESLVNVLRRVHVESGLPLYVTENGAAFADVVGPDGRVDDPQRVAYLDAYTTAVMRAVAEGVDVRGYFAWSLLDNFEWAEGYGIRFGLIYVDYVTQRRIPKTSADWYRRHITRHSGRAVTDGAAADDLIHQSAIHQSAILEGDLT